jgi:hydrogenase maturation protein HypF
MCPECSGEYDDPANRRFHAQPNACPECGPQVWLTDSRGSLLCSSDAMDGAARDLAQGMILALKGLGGFHLACSATHDQAVQKLRTRKNRRGKPLAVMVPDLETARTIGEVSRKAAEWLTGTVRPIVLVPKKPGNALSEAVSPDTATVGLMLPYTPLHHILFELYRQHLPGHDLPALVMTSGNLSSEPIALGNREALGRLGPLADRFLFHNRDILVRTDDSVLGVLPDTEQTLMFRRARGFTPSPIELDRSGPCVLGVGPELKSTVCLTKNSQAFPSQHIGDLQNLETFEFFQETIRHLTAILQVEPELMVTDLHPDFLSTRFAVDQDKLPVLSLQHHFAHVHAVLAENRHHGPALGMILDGTGLGLDGSVWGGELLKVDSRTNDHERLGHFARVAMPGGEQAIEEPWRMAQASLHALGHKRPHARVWPWLRDRARPSQLVGQMLDRDISCLPTTSCGRLFDAVSALLGLCQRIEYEGQAAIILEAIQDRAEGRAYPCPVKDQDGLISLDTLALFAAAHQDWTDHVESGRISRRFHLGLARGLKNWALAAREMTGISHVALSGGVFQNQTLNQAVQQELTAAGLTPLIHLHMPPNDACISLGQASFGRQQLLLASS